VAIREGNFGKGAKSGGGGGAEDSVGKDKRFSKGESYVAGAAAHEEKWMTSVDARAYARVGGGGAGCDHLYECEEETGLGQEEVRVFDTCMHECTYTRTGVSLDIFECRGCKMCCMMISIVMSM